jgi:hypothetical protein
MKMFEKILTTGLLVLLTAPLNPAFAPDDEENTLAELQANARELLVETSSMALNLRSPTNRINFSIRSADILWDLNEAEARAMFNASVEEIKALFGQIDLAANQIENGRSAGRPNRSAAGELRADTNQAFSLRSALITALSNHDPAWALRFLQETGRMITNPTLQKRIERDDKRAETQIARKFAAKDITKALEIAREKLSKGVDSEAVNLLDRIYAQDKQKGADFGADVLRKFKSLKYSSNQTWLLVRLFQSGLAAQTNNVPLFDKTALKDLAELLAGHVTNATSRYRTLPPGVMTGLEKVSPNRAAEIKRTFDQRTAARNANRGGINAERSSYRNMWEERAKLDKEMSAEMDRLENETLTSEDRQKIIGEARSRILAVEDENYRFRNLVGLAIGAFNAGEMETASEIMNEAEFYAAQDLRDKNDFSNNRTLADGYALVDPDKAFAILENMIYRLNGVINGYIRYMEFNGSGRIVENNELIMNNRSRQFTNYFRFTPPALKSLAAADYARLRNLSDKFERAEIRIETRLLIAEALLKLKDRNIVDETKSVGLVSFEPVSGD